MELTSDMLDKHTLGPAGNTGVILFAVTAVCLDGSLLSGRG